MYEMNGSFAKGINKSFNSDPSESVLDALFREYEQVIFRSIITSFGLDAYIRDQYGGDVDTILGVRSIKDDDSLLEYKSVKNKTAYEERGEYTHKYVEGSGTNFQAIKKSAREFYDKDPRNNTVQDAYEDRSLHFLRHGVERPVDKNAELDHVISAKNIHDDRGRVLAGLNTEKLANSEDNLKWTNEHLNKSSVYVLYCHRSVLPCLMSFF